jgi:hypothetical protein
MGKFRGNAQQAISEKQTEAVADAVNRLESVENVKDARRPAQSLKTRVQISCQPFSREG